MHLSRIIISLCFFIIQSLSTSILSGQSAANYTWLPDSAVYLPLYKQIPTPPGFKRIPVNRGTYARWLRGLPLYPSNTAVRDYQGRIRVQVSDTTLAAIVYYDIQGKKLEQCMDIIQRLWAEYLWSNTRANELSFIMPGGQSLAWNKWAAGFRPTFNGVNISLHLTARADSSKEAFEDYLWLIFYHSFTQTAYVGYPSIRFEDLKIGDFIVKKGRRGHAVLVVDLAINDNNELMGLIGHGDTPARNFYIINYRENQPWFPLSASQKYIPFPFKKKMDWSGLRRFYSNPQGHTK